jgi:hypothetical protein
MVRRREMEDGERRGSGAVDGRRAPVQDSTPRNATLARLLGATRVRGRRRRVPKRRRDLRRARRHAR